MPDAGRVIAGTARGIRLLAPAEGTRALSDRVKQTLFAILEPELRGARVLDLFAGSGAAGIEALSRGAASVVFVERDRGAVVTIEDNLRRTGLGGPRATVARADVADWLVRDTRSGPPFDVVIVDPPYADADTLLATLDRLGADGPGGIGLADRATVVAKHSRRTTPAAVVGLLASERERRIGETALTFYRRTSPQLREG